MDLNLKALWLTTGFANLGFGELMRRERARVAGPDG